MTLERCIGYSGFFLILTHALPFSNGFVLWSSIAIGVLLIFSATYLRWKNKIQFYIQSKQGAMSLPHFFDRLSRDAKLYKSKKHHK